MMIRFFNGKILKMTDGNSICGGELWVDGEKISYIGEKPASLPDFEREIDLCGNLLMPSFKNAHTHSAMTFLRSFADDLPLREWLFDKVFPLEAKLNPDYIYHLTKLAILEYLSSGISASFDMYFHPDAYVAANDECGFRTVLCGSVSGSEKNAIRLQDEYNKYCGFNSRISYILGFHAEYTAEKPLLCTIGKLSQSLKAPVFTHNSETESEVAECISRHGMTPTALFDSLGIYDNGGGGFHCVHLSDDDIAIFKKRRLTAVSCPASNAKLASGIAPLTKLHDNGIALALGTDGAASNNCLDMFREMFLATALQKLACRDAAALDADIVLEAATKGSAHAMGLFDCDYLDIGKKADLIVIDLMQPNMQPLHQITKNLVYSGSKTNVKLTMVNGKILYENGEYHIGESAESIYSTANRIVSEILAQ